MGYKNPDAQRAYARRWIAERRAAWLAVNGPCRCGASDHLEVHHKDPAQKVSHSVWSWSEVRRLAELAKCEVLCADCHQIEHGRGVVTHGTFSGYNHHGCRCDVCRSFKTNYERHRLERRRSTVEIAPIALSDVGGGA